MVRPQGQYPDWWVWVSDTGTWWASRRDQLTLTDTVAGLVPYLRADCAEDLKALLNEQDSATGGDQ
ncbi:hypothetical protein BZB76_5725 [Actinomadura pelletieri DSM 43383]|uniref:Uncharacterized protein n=1 Tax=Actinomadura pelletieri DSM 43383 TaxID=1120940 RepID=A0A495QH59_9ACTN|nr:hypothetical protein [Actinomadura pelletieri]RKS71237.1 hypothetical protein BZB76_5725 [Actinomadura pelletieri DSM 43383]